MLYNSFFLLYRPFLIHRNDAKMYILNETVSQLLNLKSLVIITLASLTVLAVLSLSTSYCGIINYFHCL